MSALFAKPSNLITVAMLLGIVALWQFPLARLTLTMILLLFSVARALASVIAKHREAHLRGRITSIVFVRNVLIETTFLLVVMVLAGFLARHFAQIATQQISNEFMKFVAGIGAGLLVGIGVGAVLHLLWGRFVKTSAEN